ETEDPGIDDLYRVGTACAILKVLNLPDGTLSIIVHGLTRFGLAELVQTEPFLLAQVQTHDDPADKTPELDALVHTARQAAYRIFELSPNVPDEARIILDNIDSAGGVADFLAANLSVGLINRQELLETFDVGDRLRKINTALAEQVQLLELSNKIQTQVRQQIDKSQREYYLQEQLKAIQKELGEGDGRSVELDRLRERMKAAKMPDAAREEAERELNRMVRIPQASPEYSVALDYVTWLCDLPWALRTEDRLDLRRAARILDADHYGLEKVKQRILEFLAVRKLKPEGRGPILCFLGPPGVGKTSLGQSIARALGRKFVRMSLGGMHDEAQLRGHRRTYIGAMPGRILQEIRKLGSNNPVFMLDEVDKIGQDFRGDPASALLEILDPAQNHSFTDNYIDVPFDLSKVMFIATANYNDPIPAPLRDRMETLELSGYTTREKLCIARRYLVPRQRQENGLNARLIGFDNGSLDLLATQYTREAGVRNLERQIAAVCRAVAARVARGRRQPVRLTTETLERFLGAPRFESEAARQSQVCGIAIGLAYTPTGGEILFIEAIDMPGQGKLTLTGQLGEVMKESAQAAYSILRSSAAKLRIEPDRLAQCDVHVHVPAGAIPKDGPSAGVAMLSAMVSLFTGRPCRSDVALTGEITLTGRVLPIGGLKEKVIAAHRAGIRQVVLPAGNRKDLADIPADVRRKVKLVFADRVEGVLKVVLMPGKGKS
ncbi:MAG: endopeptidase La, partial [Phycisphaerae bacterium]|nr:endopeptidase La [Phycisphaerae bacterium]